MTTQNHRHSSAIVRLFFLVSILMVSIPPATPQAAPLVPVDTQAMATSDVALYRSTISLQQPTDRTRLDELDITILSDNNDTAVVLVDGQQLTTLARLGFRPSGNEELFALVNAQDQSFAWLSGSMRPLLGQVTQVHNRVVALSANPSEAQDAEDIEMEALTELRAAAQELLPEQRIGLSQAASTDDDGDGLTNTEELWWCTDPQDPHTRGNANSTDYDYVARLTQYLWQPWDGDNRLEGPPFQGWSPETTSYNYPDRVFFCPDTDGDSVPDGAERMLGLSDNRPSTDRDRYNDGLELFKLDKNNDTLPAFVVTPGNHPMVAAYPKIRVDAVPSSFKVEVVTEFTSGVNASTGTAKTYGTEETRGVSDSVADTETWNSWQEVSVTKPIDGLSQVQSVENPRFSDEYHESVLLNNDLKPIIESGQELLLNADYTVGVGAGSGGVGVYGEMTVDGKSIANVGKSVWWWLTSPLTGAPPPNSNSDNNKVDINSDGTCDCDEVQYPDSVEVVRMRNQLRNSQDRIPSFSGTSYNRSSQNGNYYAQRNYPVIYPVLRQQPTRTVSNGSSRGGAHTTTHTEYQEHTIIETEQFATEEGWSEATTTNSAHSANLTFSYSVSNEGTDVARTVDNLIFNVYIGRDPNPAFTCQTNNSPEGGNCNLVRRDNVQPGVQHTYTSAPIHVSMEQMKAIDLGGPIYIVLDSYSMGEDDLFFEDARQGGITVFMDDGVEDGDESQDVYILPTWEGDQMIDVLGRYFPIRHDAEGDVLSITTPEFAGFSPRLAHSDVSLAAEPTWNERPLQDNAWFNLYLDNLGDGTELFRDIDAQANSTLIMRYQIDTDYDGYSDRSEKRLGTDPDNVADHPSPGMVAALNTSQSGTNYTGRLALLNTGTYDSYGVEAIMYAPDPTVSIQDNTIGGGGRVRSASQVVLGSQIKIPDQTNWKQSSAKPYATGNYSGNNDVVFTFTAQDTGAVGGAQPIKLKWSSGNGNGILTIPANYQSPLPLDVAQGVQVGFYTGSIIAGDSFSVTAALPLDTFKYTIEAGSSTMPRVVVNYNDPQGSHRFITHLTVSDLGSTLPTDPDLMLKPLSLQIVTTAPVTPSVTNTTNYIFNLPDSQAIVDGQLFINYLSIDGDLVYEQVFQQTFQPGPNIIPVTWNTDDFTRPFDPDQGYNVLALVTDWEGNIIQTLARPLFSFQQDPTPTLAHAEDTWDFGTVVKGQHLEHTFSFANTGETGMFGYITSGPGLSIQGVNSRNLLPGDMENATVVLDTSALPIGRYDETITLRTSDVNNPTKTLRVTGMIVAGNDPVVRSIPNRPLDLDVTIPGQHSDNEQITFIHALGGKPQSLHPVVVYSQNYEKLWGWGKYARAFGHPVTGGNTGCLKSLYRYWNETLQRHFYTSTISELEDGRDGWRYEGIVGAVAATSNCYIPNAVPLYRFLDADNYKHFYTASEEEADIVRARGWKEEGIVGYVSPVNASEYNTLPLHRLYRTISNDHFYTASTEEKEYAATNHGYIAEGTAGYIFNPDLLLPPETSCLKPMLRYWNWGTQKHFYTSNRNELGGGQGLWRYEGVEGYVAATPDCYAPGAQPLYRLWHEIPQKHIYTANPEEAARLESEGWVRQETVGYISTSNAPQYNTFPLYRLYRDMNEDHFYTISVQGKDYAIATYGYIEEGITGYIYSSAALTALIEQSEVSPYTTIRYTLPEPLTGGRTYRIHMGRKLDFTNARESTTTLRVPAGAVTNATLSAMVSSVGTGDLTLRVDIGNNGSWDWEATHSVNNTVTLDSPQLAAAFTQYWESQGSPSGTLDVPVTVSLSTGGQVLLTNFEINVNDVDATPIPADISFGASNPTEGEDVEVTATLRNKGGTASGPLTAAFYAEEPFFGETYIGSALVPAIEAGGTAQATILWNTLNFTGTIPVRVIADPFNRMAEISETNNSVTTTLQIRTRPDLYFSDITLSNTEPVEGESVMVTLQVRNAGQTSAGAQDVALYLGNPDAGGSLIGTQVLETLAPGADATLSFTWVPTATGDFHLVARADQNAQISEFDEVNNDELFGVYVGFRGPILIDSGGASDVAYTPTMGYGYIDEGVEDFVMECGGLIYERMRLDTDGKVRYRFDHLLPGHSYHLDITLYECDGAERQTTILVDDNEVAGPVVVRNGEPHRLSLRLDPAFYTDHAIDVALEASGIDGVVIAEINLHDIDYRYADSGKNQDDDPDYPGGALASLGKAYGALNGGGQTSQGILPYQSIRINPTDSNVSYRFDGLDPNRQYQIYLTFWQESGAGREQTIQIDGNATGVNVNTSDYQIARRVIDVPVTAYADDESITVDIVRTDGSTGAFVNEIALEEVTSVANTVVPVADFSASPTTGPAPLTVQFRDLSRGLIAGRTWDFGDGVPDNRTNPTHTFNQPGIYTVQLVVEGINGSDTKVLDSLVEVKPPDANQTTMRFDPVSIPGTLGRPTTVAVVIDNVSDLGAFQFTITYESDKTTIESIELGEFPGSTGRAFTTRPVTIDPANGTATFSAYSNMPDVMGAEGSGVLAYIQGVLRSSPSTLSLSNVQVTDVTGNEIATVTQGASVNSNACPGDFDGDGDRDTLDVQRVAYLLDTGSGDILYDPLYDGDNDGDIDIADVQRVAALWGTRCDGMINIAGTRQATESDKREFRSSFVELNALPPSTGSIIASDNTTLNMIHPDITITAGQTYTVPVTIENASDIAAFGFTTFYSPTLVEVIDVTISPFVTSSDRTFQSLGPLNNETAGWVTFGAYSLGATETGPSGSGTVAILTLRAKIDGGSPLRLMAGRTSDAVGNAQSICLSPECRRVQPTSEQDVFLPFIQR